MDDCKPISTPLDINQKISKDMCPQTKEESDDMKTIPYQEAIGSIMYAAQVSRPDVSFAVGALARYNNNPGKAHWQAVKRIMRYLKGTINYKLQFSKDENAHIEGISDADWAGDLDDRKSTSGYVFKFQGGCISWNSKKQQTTALSTTEAEYMALAAAGQEALWLRSLFNELGRSSSIVIKCDYKSAINLSHNSTYHARSKHIDIRHHFIRNLVNDKKVVIEYLNTEDMAADVLTKSLTSLKHLHCCDIMNLGVHPSGGVGE
ncbi:secreted RxLR effector protein 161-like [Lucilia sericata]|uniref:secreted RxLR effector protein 161-like n=1 Tax=Lucilia sericata TaxID=13632 RepID=UPI0018A876E3|nr:secreted RxLR effector protein 161-like [Lucilia sericata]